MIIFWQHFITLKLLTNKTFRCYFKYYIFNYPLSIYNIMAFGGRRNRFYDVIYEQPQLTGNVSNVYLHEKYVERALILSHLTQYFIYVEDEQIETTEQNFTLAFAGFNCRQTCRCCCWYEKSREKSLSVTFFINQPLCLMSKSTRYVGSLTS